MQADKSIQIPQRISYGFERMEIGDSFFFDDLVKVERCAAAAYSYAKTSNPLFKMTRRKVEGGYRIWRIR